MKCLFLFLFTAVGLSTKAYDYDAIKINGIFYNINYTTKTAEVTYKNPIEIIFGENYTGDITIPSTITYNNDIYSVTAIGEGAFRDCSALTSITIPNSVTSIGEGAFWGCSGLTSITIPNSVTSIGYDAFSGCGIEEWIIKVFDYAAFCNNTITNIISSLSNTQTTIKLIDENGNNIKDYIIPNNVTCIGKKAFYYTDLTSVTIPNSVTTIGDSAFVGCSNLKSVRMGSGIKNVGYLAFGGCKKIEEVHVDDLAAWCNIDFKTEAYSSDYGVYLTSHASNPIAARVYGSGIYTGGGGATLYLQGKAVSNLKIPDGVTMIKPNVFAYSNIQTVTIPSSITTIYENAFYKCTNLKGIYINDISAWCNIDFITYVTYPTVWSRSSQEANPLIYAHNLYLNEKKVTNLSVPSRVKQIKPYAFYNCSLESVVLPNGFTTIGESAFSSCQDLKTVVIPNTVTSIGKEAFSNCMSLYSVTSLINMPFNLDESVFQYTGTQYDKNIVYMAATLYVPRGRTAMYSNVEGWKKFMNITETDTKFKLTYMLDGAVYKTYEIQATEVITPEPDPYKEHYIFSGWSEIPYLMPAQDVTITGSFTIDPEYQLSVNSVSKDDAKPAIIYSVDGRMQKTQQRGLNIIRMSDGTVRKVMIK